MKKLNDLLSTPVCVAWFLGLLVCHLGHVVYPQRLPWLWARVALEGFHFVMGLVCVALCFWFVFYGTPAYRAASKRD